MRDHDPRNARFDADDTTDSDGGLALGSVRDLGAEDDARWPRSSSHRSARGCVEDVHDRPTFVP
ncbi:MAG: hypothetical protein KF764_12945 [Labilithrix sp.]|nr:hypothetical protein [Labilithrix sp.]MBX3221553.1 hypothetical protein [Labilithrix sp.]